VPDALLSPEDRKEALSRVYVQAIAARAGYVTDVPDFDRDSIDLIVRAGGAARPALDLQLKATTVLDAPYQGDFKFSLSRKNYDDLRAEAQIPRLLIVFNLPRQEEKWMTIGPEKLILRRCAYWLNLSGREETANQSSVTVRIPEVNLFTVEAMRHLMEQSRLGRLA